MAALVLRIGSDEEGQEMTGHLSQTLQVCHVCLRGGLGVNGAA